MKTFHHGGRIGDMIFALWTMRALGGGRLVVTNYHKGNWNLDIARSMSRFLVTQSYIDDIDFEYYANRGTVDYDLTAAEQDFNPEAFPDYDGSPWPGNAMIARRYALHFGLSFDGQPWLECPIINNTDIAFHCPIRRSVRPPGNWFEIVTVLNADHNLRVAVLGNEGPLGHPDQSAEWDLLDSASYIAGSTCFLGTVSSCNAIAEGLGKKRFVEHAQGCFNVTPDVILNGMSNSEVVDVIAQYCGVSSD